MSDLVKLLIGRAVVRYLNGDMKEFKRLKSIAIDMYTGGKCTINGGAMMVTVRDILQNKGVAI